MKDTELQMQEQEQSPVKNLTTSGSAKLRMLLIEE